MNVLGGPVQALPDICTEIGRVTSMGGCGNAGKRAVGHVWKLRIVCSNKVMGRNKNA